MEGEPRPAPPERRKGLPAKVERTLTDERFAAMLAAADGAAGLKDLHRLVTAYEAIARQCDLAFEELHRLAAQRLRVERELGSELARSSGRGGSGSKLQRATSKRGGASRPLPRGVNKHDAKRHRDLAAIPEDAFTRYLTSTRTARRLPTATGARRFSNRRAPRASDQPRSRPVHALPAGVAECVMRIMDVDVLVGSADVPSQARVRYRAEPETLPLQGNVLVSHCEHPARWLPAIKRLREQAIIHQAIVVLRAEVWEPWFRMLDTGWRCCFLTGIRVDGCGIALTHHGARGAAFTACLAQRGWAVTGS